MPRRPLISVGFAAVALAMRAKIAQQHDADVVDLLVLTGRAGDTIPAEMHAAILAFAETYRHGPIAAGHLLHDRILALLPAPPPPAAAEHAWQSRRDLQ